MKYLVINLQKHVHHPYAGNKTIWIKEIKEELIKWIGRVNIVHLLILPKLIHRFFIIPIKITNEFSVDRDKMILKFACKRKETRITKIICQR